MHIQKKEHSVQLKAFSIRDNAVKSYERPFFQNSSEEAIRSFRNQIKNPQTIWHANPEDFDLFHLGFYDTETGIFTSLDTPSHIEKAINLKE